MCERIKHLGSLYVLRCAQRNRAIATPNMLIAIIWWLLLFVGKIINGIDFKFNLPFALRRYPPSTVCYATLPRKRSSRRNTKTNPSTISCACSTASRPAGRGIREALRLLLILPHSVRPARRPRSPRQQLQRRRPWLPSRPVAEVAKLWRPAEEAQVWVVVAWPERRRWLHETICTTKEVSLRLKLFHTVITL